MNHEKQLSAEEFDRRFETGEDISAHVDWTEARHLGVSRQALVKVWIANCLARDAHSAR